ncbi:MAG TPA: GyrI-like domain-containing protein [Bacillota bacterium]|nr:GyrI-like domain-containing protein [Bacillota bacterium]
MRNTFFYKNRKLKEMRLYLPLAKKNDANPCARNIIIRTEPEKRFIICRQEGPDAEAKAIEIFSQWAKGRQIDNVRTYYIAAQDHKYECGIPYLEPLDFPETNEIRLKVIPAGLYATYSENNFGNVATRTNQMAQWLQSDPRYAPQGEYFAVYHTEAPADTGAPVRMEVFIPVKKSC